MNNGKEMDAGREERVRLYKEQRRVQLAARTAALMSDHVTTRKPIKKLADHPIALDSRSVAKSSSEVNLSNRSPPNVRIRTTRTSRLRAEALGKCYSLEEVNPKSVTHRIKPRRAHTDTTEEDKKHRDASKISEKNTKRNGNASKSSEYSSKNSERASQASDSSSKSSEQSSKSSDNLARRVTQKKESSIRNNLGNNSKDVTTNGNHQSNEEKAMKNVSKSLERVSKLADISLEASCCSKKDLIKDNSKDSLSNNETTDDKKTKNTAIYRKNNLDKNNIRYTRKSSTSRSSKAVKSDVALCEAVKSDVAVCEAVKSDVALCEAVKSDVAVCEAEESDVVCESSQSEVIECDVRKKSVQYCKVHSFSELLNNSNEEAVEVVFEQILADNGIGDENVTLRLSMFNTSCEEAVASPVQLVEPLLQPQNGGHQKKRSIAKTNSGKTESTPPKEKQPSKSLTNSPARKISPTSNIRCENKSPTISPQSQSNKKNGRSSMIPTPTNALERNAPTKTVKTNLIGEEEVRKTTHEKDKRLNSIEKKREEIDLSLNDNLASKVAVKTTSKDTEQIMSMTREEISTRNMRFSQRVDSLAEFTRKTLDRVDKLASKSNSTVGSSGSDTMYSLSNQSTSKDSLVDNDITTRGVNERLQDIEAAAQRLIEFERQNAICQTHQELNYESSHFSSANNAPVSILKRKSINEESSLTPPVTFSPNVLEPRPSRQESRKQGILKKRCSLDESQVSCQRSCSPEVSFADDAYDNNKPILKNRRSSLEDVIRSHSPDGHIQGILKRRTSKDDDLHLDDTSLGSPEPHGILKKKSVSSSSSSSASSHVSIAQAVILAAAGGAEIIEDDNIVRPILKKKSFSEERTCPEVALNDQPKPILKKKSSEQDDCDKPKKPILKTRRCEEDGNASSFDLSEDDRSSRRPSLLRSRTSDQSDSDTSVRPILKQRANSVGRDRSESPRMRLSFYGDSHENNPIVNYLTEIQHEATALDSIDPKNFYSSDVLRRRKLRPKAEVRAQSVGDDTNYELFTILSDRRRKVDEICAADSPQLIDDEEKEEREIKFISVADRIRGLERCFAKVETHAEIVERKNRKNRSSGRFSTQPITIDEIQFVTDSLDSCQNAAENRLFSNIRDGNDNEGRGSEQSNYWRETGDLVNGTTDNPADFYDGTQYFFGRQDSIELLGEVVAAVANSRNLIELSEEAFEELERTQLDLQKALDGLTREEDERSLSVSCDSGVYNRRNGDDPALLTEPSTTESDPASLEMAETKSASPQDEADGEFLGGLVRSNSVSARASMWQALQEQQAKAVSRPPPRHTRSKNKENNADRFRSQQIVWRGAGPKEEVTPAVRSRSFDVDDEDEAEKTLRPRYQTRKAANKVSGLATKPLSKGDSSEGLKDEGIDSSSEDEPLSSSDENESTSPEPLTRVVYSSTEPQPKRAALSTSRTDSDITRVDARLKEEKQSPLQSSRYNSPFGDASKLKSTTDSFVKRGLLKKQNSTDCDITKLVNMKPVLSPEKMKFFGLTEASLKTPVEKPKEARPDFARRWSSSGSHVDPSPKSRQEEQKGKNSVAVGQTPVSLGQILSTPPAQPPGHDVSEGSDGDSSGGREVRRITSRRRLRASNGSAGPPQGPGVLQRSKTHGDVMPQRGGTIADRLAALQAAGANEWKNRVSRISPENDQTKDIKHVQTKITEQLTQGVEKRIQVDEKEVGKDILVDRRSKLETAAQGWRRRVPEKDADALTVQARLPRRVQPPAATPPPTAPTPLTAASPPVVPIPSPFKSRRLQETNGFGAGPLRSASLAVVGPAAQQTAIIGQAALKSTEKFKRSQSVSEDIVGEAKKKKASSVVTVPRADDETFSSFFSSVSQSIGTSTNSKDEPKIDVDLDAIQNDTVHLLVSNVSKRAKAARKVQSSRNPLRRLQERGDLSDTYTERHIEINSLAKSSSKPMLAAEALAALAAREDFSNVSLRSVNHNENRAPISKLLLHVKGRRRVQTRLVEPVHTNINRGDCFILVCSDKVFLYIGLYSNVIERSRAKDIALHIHSTKDLGCTSSIEVITLDESKTLNKQEWKDFWSILGANNPDQKPVESGNAEEDEIYESSIIHTNMCYELIDDELIPIKEYWGQVPKIAMLNTSKVIVFDFGSEMFVWYGKNVPLERRRLAANLAQELFDQGYDYSQCNINPVNFAETVGFRDDLKDLQLTAKKRPEWAMFTKVTQHMESVLFREKFLDWPDFTRVIKVAERDEKSSSAEEIRPYDADLMLKFVYEDPDLALEGSHLGRGAKYYDKETMRHFEIKTKSVEKWFVQDSDYHKIENETELPVFYTGDSYIIRWEYQVAVAGRELNGKPSKFTQTGRDRFAYFFWQGKDATPNEKGTAALLTVELDKEKGPQVRVSQGNEPPAFLRLFNGDLIIRKGKKSEAKSQIELFVSRGCVLEEAYLLQVVCSARMLRARASHVLALHATRMLVVRHGARSRQHTREITEELAKRLAKRFGGYGVKSELDGHESSIVRVGLGLNSSFSGAGDGANDQEDAVMVTPRMWQFTDLLGKFEAVEILSPLRHENLVAPFPFEQKEVYGASQPAMFMVDDGSTVWVWQGWWPQQEGEMDNEGNSSAGAFVSRWLSIRQASLETALEYSKKKYTTSSDANLVFAGLEPDAFIQLFDDWVQNDDAAEANMQAGYKPSELRSASRELRTLSGPVTLELAALQQRPLPPGLSPQHLERHLATPDFIEAFGMSPDDFANLPAWKQTQLKKDLGLF